MNAFSVPLCDSMRSSKAFGKSTDEKVAALETGGELLSAFGDADPGSWSLDDLGHEIQAIADGRRVFLEMIAVIRLGDLIGAQPLSLIERVRHRHDVVGSRLASWSTKSTIRDSFSTVSADSSSASLSLASVAMC